MQTQHEEVIDKRKQMAQLAAAIVGCDEDKVMKINADVVGMTVTYSTDVGQNTTYINWSRMTRVGVGS